MLGRRAAGALALGGLGGLAFLACSLDWQVRSDPGAQPSPPDAANERGEDHFVPVPVEDAGDAAVIPVDADSDADASDRCAALQAELLAQLNKARACSFLTGECQLTVKDQCNCDVVVANPDASATTDFRSSVAQLKAECSLACGTCPSTTGRACLAKGTKIECYPP
jgi:hypothetical protein